MLLASEAIKPCDMVHFGRIAALRKHDGSVYSVRVGEIDQIPDSASSPPHHLHELSKINDPVVVGVYLRHKYLGLHILRTQLLHKLVICQDF